MKKILVIMPVLFTVAVALAVGGYFIYLSSLNGRPLACNGDVKVLKADTGKWENFDSGYQLKDGDTVKTGPASSCELTFGNTASTVIKAGENTELKVLAKNPVGLELVDGDLLAALTRPGQVKNFTVKTPVGTCGVRGTGWKVSSREASESTVEVFEGRVKFGETEQQYDRDPYIARSDQKLKVVKKEATSCTYAKLEPEKYTQWNKWVEGSSDKLSRIKVANNMAVSEADPYPVWQEGITYASWHPTGYISPESDISFAKMEEETGASWVNLITTWYQDETSSTKLWIHPEKTPTDESLEYVIKKAQRRGLHIMLTIQVDLAYSAAGAWRTNIGFKDNEQWDEWFRNYEQLVMHYAHVASRNDVELYNIGTELGLTSTQRPDKWIELISKVRKIYNGKLVYTANWFEEYQDVTFWEYLDYAGISAYFPLADTDKPSYGEIKKNWEEWCDQIEAWQKTHGKPVIFPEVGYRSMEGSAKEPWDFMKNGRVDLEQQYNCYRAVFETFWQKEWFYGMYWWTWRTYPYIQGKYHKGFTVNDKPTVKLVKTWFLKPDPHRYKSDVDMLKDTLAFSKQ